MKRGLLSFIRGDRGPSRSLYVEGGPLGVLSRECMGKRAVLVNRKEVTQQEAAFSTVRKTLGDQCLCCILITCSQPSAQGKMEVDMRFEGDEMLAGFLLDNAHDVFNAKWAQREMQ